MKYPLLYTVLAFTLAVFSCGKSSDEPDTPPTPKPIAIRQVLVNGSEMQDKEWDISLKPVFSIRFNEPVLKESVNDAVDFKADGNAPAPVFTTALQQNDSVLVISTTQPLTHFSRYVLSLKNSLKSVSGGRFISTLNKSFLTSLDSSTKFDPLSDDALLTKVQQQSFRYFWDFGHPVSGMARERNSSGDLVTTGGTGFGIMALVTGIEREFITRQEGLQRIQRIVDFLQTKAIRYHGAFAHWLNGDTGLTIPFSEKDNGADLVETSFLMMGLLTARQYFNQPAPAEVQLRDAITDLYEAVEWTWFQKNNEPVLYWHWSPEFGWDMNLPIRGWNECLVTYVLAAGSPTHPITADVYDKGWARDGALRNGAAFYGISLPLGEDFGGPLFLSQYSFLGINPFGLKDKYADYEVQNRNHARIHYQHSLENPNEYFGYSGSVWGLTASDIPNGYTASSPLNDRGVIAPTAALSSFPYTPEESMQALRFYYYILGDKLFKEYGFIDAFSLQEAWFANSFLAIDQAPVIVMIENYRTRLCWELFSGAPEVKGALIKLGFTAPWL